MAVAASSSEPHEAFVLSRPSTTAFHVRWSAPFSTGAEATGAATGTGAGTGTEAGAAGLGAVALNYGYQSFNNSVLYTSVLILLVMVQVIQMAGNWLYKRSLNGK